MLGGYRGEQRHLPGGRHQPAAPDHAPGEALVEAGTTRLRPILMTTLTTIISMVPMIFSTDSGMSMMKDMALYHHWAAW